MFYDIFNGLCEINGVSKTKAATEMGLSNATPTKWRKTGATPDGATIAVVAKYFGVEPNFLMGFTQEGYLLETQYQLKRLEEEYANEKDQEKKAELGYAIDIVRESYEDQQLAAKLSQGIKKDPPSGSEDGLMLSDRERSLILRLRSAPLAYQESVFGLIEASPLRPSKQESGEKQE